MYSSSNTNPCKLLVLVGLKGAGKTFIGSVLEEHLNIKFLRIEPIFLEILRTEPGLEGIALEQRGFQTALEILDELAQSFPTLCIESTGTAHTFPELLAVLRQTFQVMLIHVIAAPDICVERVLTRDATMHIPVSDNRLREINAVALQVQLPWDLEIDNTELQPESAIVQVVRPLVHSV